MPKRHARAKDVNLPIEFIRQCFAYDPLTGRLFWRERPRKHFDSDKAHEVFNAQRAFTEAFAKPGTDGYLKAKLRYNGSIFYIMAHRVAWAVHTGAWPQGEIDHWDRNRSNTKFKNLRDVSRNLNGFNRNFQPNLTGATGVKRSGKTKFSALIRHNGKRLYLGTFDTVDDASRAYQRAAESIHGHGARS